MINGPNVSHQNPCLLADLNGSLQDRLSITNKPPSRHGTEMADDRVLVGGGVNSNTSKDTIETVALYIKPCRVEKQIRNRSQIKFASPKSLQKWLRAQPSGFPSLCQTVDVFVCECVCVPRVP